MSDRIPPNEAGRPQLSEEELRALEADHPGEVLSAMTRSLRPGKVFVDWSQNSANKTTIAPYSLRGQLRPLVAALLPDFSTSFISGRDAFRVGTRLNSRPVSTEIASVKSSTRRLMCTSSSLGSWSAA